MSAAHRLLIVEDEEAALRLLQKYFVARGYTVRAARDGREGWRIFQEETFDIVLLDRRMPGMDGEELFQEIHRIDPLLPVIFMTAHGDVDSAVRLLRAGAFHFIGKPFELEELDHLVRQGLARITLERENAVLKQKAVEHRAVENLIYSSREMAAVVNLALRVAESGASVLLGGESGTGKEIVAGLIHQSSPRAGKPFVKVHLAALPATLLEAELFGHEKGAFTGAERARAGRFAEAAGGTIFLDEIGDLPAETQVKLLRVLQEREVTRLGANRPETIDFRLICATHRNLADEVRAGRFREDLYFRINTISIEIPPLRRRRDDIPLLVRHFLERFSARETKEVRTISHEAMKRLIRYDYPGNVRELEHIIERAVILARDSMLTSEDIDLPTADPAVPAIQLAGRTLPELMREIETQLIRDALQHNHHIQTRAAAELGISESTLRYRLEKLGIPSADSET